MYEDSQYGLCIDLSGPEGNAFCLLGYAKQYAKQIPGKDGDAIMADMMAGDYNHLIDVFETEFGGAIKLVNKPGEPDDDYEDYEDDDAEWDAYWAECDAD